MHSPKQQSAHTEDYCKHTSLECCGRILCLCVMRILFNLCGAGYYYCSFTNILSCLVLLIFFLIYILINDIMTSAEEMRTWPKLYG